MNFYEHVFLVRQDSTIQQIDQFIEQYKNIIINYSGKINRVENWGLRTLSYRIKKNKKAYYILMYIETTPNAILEMERKMKINDSIIRFLTIKVNQYSNEPSPMFVKKDIKEDEKNKYIKRVKNYQIHKKEEIKHG